MNDKRIDNGRLDARLGDLSPRKVIDAVEKATLGQVLADRDSRSSDKK